MFASHCLRSFQLTKISFLLLLFQNCRLALATRCTTTTQVRSVASVCFSIPWRFVSQLPDLFVPIFFQAPSLLLLLHQRSQLILRPLLLMMASFRSTTTR